MSSLKHNFDIFDQFLARKESRVEEVEFVEEEESSSSYYEEEIIEAPLSRLSTVHENDVSDSNVEEDVSESEVFWEDVSESVIFESENADEGDITEELDTTSDMVERVRNLLSGELKGAKNDAWEADNSSHCDSSSASGGSSSIPPMDFDLGSFQEGEIHSSDEEPEDLDPDFYEDSCRAMIAVIHPNSDPDTLLHGCDVQNLYTNLKQQYRHALRKRDTPESIKNESFRNLMKRQKLVVGDDDEDEDDDNDFEGLSLKQDSSTDWITDDAGVQDANIIPVVESVYSAPRPKENPDSEQNATIRVQKVQKWLERDADDPEDYEYACRLLCRSMYDKSDPDYDVDTLLRRSTPVDLYRYLKHQFWYLVHTDQLDHTVLHRNASNEVAEALIGAKELNDDEKKFKESTTMATNLPGLNFTSHVEQMNHRKEKVDESMTMNTNLYISNSGSDEISESENNKFEEPSNSLPTRIEQLEEKKHGVVETNFETINKNIEISTDESSLQHDGATEHGTNNGDENKLNVQRTEKENEQLDVSSKEIQSDIIEASDNTDDTEESVWRENIHKNNRSDRLLNSCDENKNEEQLEQQHVDKDESSTKDETSQESACEIIGTSDNIDGSILTGNIDKYILKEGIMSSREDNGIQAQVRREEVGKDAPSTKYENGKEIVTDFLPIAHKSSFDRIESSSKNDGTKESARKENLDYLNDTNARSHEENVDLVQLEISNLNEEHHETSEVDKLKSYGANLASHSDDDSNDESSVHSSTESKDLNGVSKHLQNKSNDSQGNFDATSKAIHEFNTRAENFPSNHNIPDVISEKDKSTSRAPSGAKRSPLSGNEDEGAQSCENDNLIERNTFSLSSYLLQNGGIAYHERARPKTTLKDPRELEWRKNKIHEDLMSIITESEEFELLRPISSEIVTALKRASLKTALTKKYYDHRRRDHLYFPSVAKVVENYCLIEEAEKIYQKEFSFELSTALCTVASSRMRGDVDEVNENDISIKEATVTVVTDDELEACSHEKAFRLKIIENELASIMHDAKQQMVKKNFESSIVCALQKGAYDLCYLERYLDTKTEKYVWYPSVAKVIWNLSLIDEAKKHLAQVEKELSPDLTKTLRNIASSYLNCNGNELEEKADVNDNKIAITDSYDFGRGNTGPKSPAALLLPSENEVRKKRIEMDLLSIVNDVEVNVIGGSIEDEAIDSLFRAANNIVFIKKYFDVKTDDFRYFPSVKSAILNNSLTERAESYYFNGVHEFPLDYKSALRTSASKLFENFEVDEHDDYVINMAIDVDIDESHEENQSEKCRDSCMTNDTVSMISSLIDGSSLNAEALLYVNEEGNSSNRQSNESSTNTSEDGKIDTGNSSKDANEQANEHRLAEAALDEKALLFAKKHLDDMQRIDKTLLELESQLMSELKRLDNEASACSLKHKIEAERIAKDRNGIQDQILVDEKNMTERTNALREKLSTTVGVLELERKNTSMGMEMVNQNKEEVKDVKNWGWFNNKPKKNNLEKERERQGKLMKFKLREIELEKDINDIKAQLDFVSQQAMAKERNIKEWIAELDDEYRHLEEVTSATEEKLKEEMHHLHTSYEEERKRLLQKKIDLENSKNEYDKKIQSGKKKLKAKYLYGEKVARSDTENSVVERLQFKQRLEEDGRHVGKVLGTEGDKRVEDIRVNINAEGSKSLEISLSESKTLNISGKHSPQFENEIAVELHTIASANDEIIGDSSTNSSCGDDDTILSNATGIAQELFKGELSIGNDVGSILSKTENKGENDNSTESHGHIVPNHLKFLNQPQNLEDEMSLRSLDVFELPEETQVSTKNVVASASNGKPKDKTKHKPTVEQIEVISDHSVVRDKKQGFQNELPIGSPRAPDLSKSNPITEIKPSTSPSKVKQSAEAETISAEADTPTRRITEKTSDYIMRTPKKSLSEMRRNVEVALDRAIAIRNGDTPSYHRRTLPYEATQTPNFESSLRSVPSLSAHSRSPTRQHVNPIYPMIRETERLAGFIRRYEKKLETVCKSLLTLASVNGNESNVLAARELDLPEMLDFVSQQDWYKAHSTELKPAEVPHFVFSKVKNRNGVDPNGNNEYMITATGKFFLEMDGPVASDVGRFLTYLSRIEQGLTRDAMLDQWKEIARLSGDEQSQRICAKLDKLISFCIESQMVKKYG